MRSRIRTLSTPQVSNYIALFPIWFLPSPSRSMCADWCADQSCPVCLDELCSKASVLTPCGHSLCLACLRTIRAPRRCPLCRASIDAMLPSEEKRSKWTERSEVSHTSEVRYRGEVRYRSEVSHTSEVSESSDRLRSRRRSGGVCEAVGACISQVVREFSEMSHDGGIVIFSI